MPTLLSTRDLGGLAEWYAAHPTTWPTGPRFDPVRRWYGRLASSEDHEAWLLTWLPGQATELHDHGGSAGAFTILTGVLTEQTPSREGAPVRLADRSYGVAAIRRFGPRHVHRVVNAGTEPAVSLHVYAPALTRMTRYAIEGGALRTLAIDEAGRDW